LLPLGSRIRISGAGSYSGEYTVEDAGRAVRDTRSIHVSTRRAAKRFATKTVDVALLQRGDGTRAD
jgi:3D (Asp-Asp-Asp) domain-containing protein